VRRVVQGTVLAIATATTVSACQFGGTQTDGTDGGVERGGPVPAAAPEKALAAREIGLAGDRIKVTLTSLAREGGLATLNFSATAVEPRSTTGWQVSSAFGSDEGPGNTSLAANGVYLIDGKNKKKHPAASDSSGQCVCSSNLSATFLHKGQSVVLSVTFAAPPANVNAVDVHIPNAGMFRNVPVS
jgi:hypothetical protein